MVTPYIVEMSLLWTFISWHSHSFYYKLSLYFSFKLIRLLYDFLNYIWKEFTEPAHLNPEHKEDISRYIWWTKATGLACCWEAELWIGLRRGNFKLGFILHAKKKTLLLIETNDPSTRVHAVTKLVPGFHTEKFFIGVRSKHQDFHHAHWVMWMCAQSLQHSVGFKHAWEFFDTPSNKRQM